MGQLHHTTASLRFFGDDLDPAELTIRLGLVPTVGVKKGGVWLTPNGSERVAQTGTWRLKATPRRPGNLDSQVQELLSGANPSLEVWHDLTMRFRSDIFVGLYLETWNDGASLEPATLAAIGERGLRLDLDIYRTFED